MGRCTAIKPNGERCKRLATNGNEWCSAHDPGRAEVRRRAASRGGRSKGSARIAELHRRLETVAERVEAGELETSRGAVVIQAIGAQIRLLEQERKQREAEEFEERIAQLEAAQDGEVITWGR